MNLDLDFSTTGDRQTVQIQEIESSKCAGFLYGAEYLVKAPIDGEVDMLLLSEAGSLGVFEVVANDYGGHELHTIGKRDPWFNKFLELVNPQS